MNRLRAAAGLAPLIEAGLREKKISAEKAAAMALFCEWALDHRLTGDPEADRLGKAVSEGLQRLEELLG